MSTREPIQNTLTFLPTPLLLFTRMHSSTEKCCSPMPSLCCCVQIEYTSRYAAEFWQSSLRQNQRSISLSSLPSASSQTLPDSCNQNTHTSLEPRLIKVEMVEFKLCSRTQNIRKQQSWQRRVEMRIYSQCWNFQFFNHESIREKRGSFPRARVSTEKGFKMILFMFQQPIFWKNQISGSHITDSNLSL